MFIRLNPAQIFQKNPRILIKSNSTLLRKNASQTALTTVMSCQTNAEYVFPAKNYRHISITPAIVKQQLEFM